MKRLGGQIRVCGGICRDGVDLWTERWGSGGRDRGVCVCVCVSVCREIWVCVFVCRDGSVCGRSKRGSIERERETGQDGVRNRDCARTDMWVCVQPDI